LSDQISLGVIARLLPRPQIEAILQATGKQSQRQRDLPAHAVVYYVVALALWFPSSYREVVRQLLEGLRWLGDRDGSVSIPSKSALSQARARLGAEPLEALFSAVARPLAQPETKGAWWRGHHLVSIDATLLDVPDSPVNRSAFDGPGGANGQGSYPQVRVLALAETGTHIAFAAALGGYRTSEAALLPALLPHLRPGMLCLCDRGFWNFSLWRNAAATGAELLWRAPKNLRLERDRVDLPDGSYLSKIHPSGLHYSQRKGAVTVRVIDYELEGVIDPEPFYRVITTMLDPEQAPAAELAALYAQRWEQESLFDELKTHLRGARIVLRSKTPDLVRQEIWGLLLAHFAVRSLMHEAALAMQEDPDRLSFLHAVRVVRRSLPHGAAFPP
jgi:hypothetical protein